MAPHGHGLRMKQRRDTGNAWQDASDKQPRRWRRRLAWLAWPAAAVAAAYAFGMLRHPMQWVLLLAGLGVAAWLWRFVAQRRRRRLWHDEPRIVRSVLRRPVRSVPTERQWKLASHPAVCMSLALALTGVLYWVAVLNGMQLPFYWLLTLALLLIANLWCWPQPWLLVLIVGSGVFVLSVSGWLAAQLSLAGAIAVMLGLIALGSAGIAGIAQRIDRNSKSR